MFVLAIPCEMQQCQSVENWVMYALKSWEVDSCGATHRSRSSECLLVTLKHALERFRSWFDQQSSADGWPCFSQIPFQLIDILHWFFVMVSVTVSRLNALVWFSWSQGEREWCMLWCLAVETVAASYHSVTLPTTFTLSSRTWTCTWDRLAAVMHEAHQICGLLTVQTSVLWFTGYG